MKSMIQFRIVLPAVALLASAVSFAQSPGEEIYKQKCVACHGADGMANAGMGKVLKVKPINDPTVKKLTLLEMTDLVRDGSGKMQPYKGELSDEKIKAIVVYLRSLSK